jgi:hypothetical protein
MLKLEQNHPIHLLNIKQQYGCNPGYDLDFCQYPLMADRVPSTAS